MDANKQHRDRFLHLHYDDDGSVSILGRLPLIEKAIEAELMTAREIKTRLPEITRVFVEAQD